MSGGSTRPYRGMAGEERRAARRAQLIAAALDLLGTEGYRATTVRAVCARANLTPRYFYESFEDLDALLVALFDDVAREVTEAALSALASAPDDDVHARARAAIAAVTETLTDDPRKGRVAFVEAVGSEALGRRRLETLHTFARLLAEQGRAFYRAPPEADRISDLTAFMLAGGFAETLIAWLDGSLAPITREQLIDDFTDLFVATGETAVAIAVRRASRDR